MLRFFVYVLIILGERSVMDFIVGISFALLGSLYVVCVVFICATFVFFERNDCMCIVVFDV